MPLQESGRERKRRRIAIACNECRDRKRKCDGVKPACGSCAKRSSQECVWEEGRSAKGWSNSYVESLRCRIQELEERHQNTAETPNFAPSSARSARSASHGESVVTPEPLAPRIAAEEAEQRRFSPHDQDMAPSKELHIPEVPVLPAASTDQSLYNSAILGYQAAPGAASLDRRSAVEDDEGEDESRIDAMGVFGSIGRGERQGSDFFGPSSTLRFLSQARRALSRSQHSPDRDRQKDAMLGFFQDEAISVGGSSGSPTFTTSKTVSDFSGHQLSIPPRNQADALLESYWIKFHSLYPFLHRPSFTEKYMTLWTPSDGDQSTQGPTSQRNKGFYDDMDDRTFHCMLNLVFALGSQFGIIEDEGNRTQLGLTFFGRAKGLINFDMLVQGNIYLVQTLILMGQYLQSTDMTSACWNMVGLAIRVSQGIGLHHEPDSCDQGCCSKGKLSQLEIEMRRRAWSGCALLDTVFSMTYGRPLMIHPAVFQQSVLPSAIDDEFLSQDLGALGAQPEDVPSLTDGYVQSIKLQTILGEVLDTLYYGSSERDNGKPDINLNLMGAPAGTEKLKNSDLQTLLNIDKSLCAWNRNLPDRLKVENYNASALGNEVFGRRTATFHRQSTILHARYLHVRLIMFRPVLSALIYSTCGNAPSEQDNSMESAMRQDMLDKGAKLCIASACDLVELVTGGLDICNDILPPPWHNVFYIHSCAIVFLICRLCCFNRIENQDTLITSWNNCLHFFRIYQSRSRSAKRCLRLFEAVQSELPPSQTDAHLVNYFGPSVGHGFTRSKGLANTDWCGDIPVQDQNPEQPLDNAIFSDQETVNWLSAPSEINWLSVFPFVEGFNDGPS